MVAFVEQCNVWNESKLPICTSRIDLCRRLRKLHSHFDVRDVSRQTVVQSRTSESADTAESFGQGQFPGYETLSVDRSLLRNLTFILTVCTGIPSFRRVSYSIRFACKREHVETKLCFKKPIEYTRKSSEKVIYKFYLSIFQDIKKE